MFPPPTFSTDVFTVIAQATGGEVTRAGEAVVERSELARQEVVAWRTG